MARNVARSSSFTTLLVIGLFVGLVSTRFVAPALGADEKEVPNMGQLISEEHSGPHATPNPITFDPDLAVVTLIVFVCLLAVLWKFAWGPITQALERREHSIADNIAAAQQSHEEAKRLLADYERRLAGAAEEIRELMDGARRDAERSKQEVLAEARTAAQAEHDRVTREIRIAADQALTELAQKGANLAVDLAGKIVGAQLKPADHAKLVQDALSNFAKASRN